MICLCRYSMTWRSNWFKYYLLSLCLLAKSVLHKLSWIQKDIQSRSFWRLLLIILRCGCFFWSNFMIFSSHIIHFISGAKYLSTTGWTRNLSGIKLLSTSSDVWRWRDLIWSCIGLSMNCIDSYFCKYCLQLCLCRYR